jgi:Lrp/AsnC family transcriptional regulator, leucine-responsive regulatory protein
MNKLNQSEKKVLTLLEENCRLPANKIAKKVRLSPEGVLKVIDRLKKQEIIKSFSTKINYSKIGYEIYPVNVKLLKLNNEIKKEIKNTISKYKICAWYSFCEGEYDLLLSFKILSEKDKQQMNQMLLEISNYILEKDISIVLHSFEISKSFLDKKNTATLFPTFNHEFKKTELKEEEIKLLEILRINSRKNILDISKEINLSPRVISLKIKKLIQQKVISGFKTKINTAILNFQPCVALIIFDQYTDDEFKKFITYCKQKKGINYFVKQIGKYDLKLTIDVYNVNDFYKLINNIREEFKFIKKITTLITTEDS